MQRIRRANSSSAEFATQISESRRRAVTQALPKSLSKFQTKIMEIRFFLKNPTIIRNEHVFRICLWCVFCDSNVDELGSSFAWYDIHSLIPKLNTRITEITYFLLDFIVSVIMQLTSVVHMKKLKNFLRKFGCGMDHVDAFSFRILETNLVKVLRYSPSHSK